MIDPTTLMHDLDIRTLVSSYTGIVLICVLASAVLWRQNHKRFPATAFWLASFLLQFVALVLVLLRGVIPDFFSIICNGAAGLLACMALRNGLEVFFGIVRSRTRDYVMLAVFIGIHLYFTYVTPSLPVRSVNYELFLIVVFVQAALVAARVVDPGMAYAGRIVAVVLAALALLNVMRIVGMLFVATGDAFFLPNAVDAAAFLAYGILMVALTFSLMMLINQGLRQDMQVDLQRIRASEEALRNSEANLKRAEAMGKTGHWELNLDTREISGSEQAAKIYGLTSTHMDFEVIRTARLETSESVVENALAGLILHDQPYDIEFKIRTFDTGEVRDVHSLASYDKPSHTVFGILRDITEQKIAEQRLLEKEGIFRMAVETSPEGFWITDTAGRLLDVNAAYCQLSGYSRDELLCMHVSDLDGKESAEETQRRIARMVHEGRAGFESVHRRKDGSQWPVEIVVSYSAVLGGRMFAFLRDITEKRSIEELNWHHANFDRLTELPNRALLFDRLSTACAQARRDHKLVAVLFIDLDGFKWVNDNFGHEAGDQVLMEAARRWAACVRSSDTVARIGGDEFAIVLGGLERNEDATSLAEKAITEMQRDVMLPSGETCRVGASIGVAFYPTDAVEMDTLVSLADEAMFQSKRSGKNTFTFSQTLVKATSPDVSWVQLTPREVLGIGVMDQQHRHLVNLLNQINASINHPASAGHPNTKFADLVGFTVLHFETELELMQRYEYPDLRQHEREHTRLVQEVKQLTKRFEEGAHMATLQVLKDWLVGHIRISDRKLAQFLIEHGCS